MEVTKSTILIITVVFILAFLGVSAYLGTLPAILSKLNAGATQIKTWCSPLINAWNGLPGEVKGVITLGIPTMAAIFFAWTKNRAMQSLNETKVEAATQAQQLTGELNQAQAAAYTTQQKLSDTEKELAVYKAEGALPQALEQIKQLNAEKSNLQVQLNQVQTAHTNLQYEFNILAKQLQINPDAALKK